MKSAAKRQIEILSPEENHPALNAILGANPFVGLDATQVLGTLTKTLGHMMSDPAGVASRALQLALELGQIAGGSSSLAPEAGDKRFADPAWSEHPVFRRMMQSYLAWRIAMHDLVNEDEGVEWKDVEQQKFAMTLMTEALAPTNLFWTNPAALKRAFDTAGMSLVSGMRNFLSDLFNNGGMPQQVDKRPFEVGRNLAISPGAVVYRTPLLRVDSIRARDREGLRTSADRYPAADQQILHHGSRAGAQLYRVRGQARTFRCSRSAGATRLPQNRDWDLDKYVHAVQGSDRGCVRNYRQPRLQCASAYARAGSRRAPLGHLAASGDQRVNAATLLVTMLDTQPPSMTGMFATEDAISGARSLGGKGRARRQRHGAGFRVAPSERPGLELLGQQLPARQDPAPFDILFWNADSTNLPAKLHAGFLDLFLRNPLTHGGEVKVLGTPIDLRAVKSDLYLVAGMTDHICAWRACYRATRMFGGRVEFVLGSSGHIQSLVNPPGNFKARYYIGAKLPEDPDEWVKGAAENKGTWWDHWIKWLARARAGNGRRRPRWAARASKRASPRPDSTCTNVTERGARERHCAPLCANLRRQMAIGNYRREISRGGAQRQFAFADGLCSVA